MVTTRAQQWASSNDPNSSPIPTDKVTEGTSKLPVKPITAAGKKAAPGKKAAVSKKAVAGKKTAVSKKAVAGKKTATGKKSPTKAATSSEDPAGDVIDIADFASPTNSVGPPITAHPPRDQAVLALSHQGPTYRAATTNPIGLYNPNALCYANVSIAMLMNLTPFVGFLEQHGSAPRYYNHDDRLEPDILARLNDIAMEYWSADERGKQTRVDALATNFKRWLIDGANRGLYDGTNPWAPAVAGHEDASESLDKILEIALMQLSTFDANEANTMEVLVQPVFQQRWACRGIGRTCPNIERVRIIPVQNDPFQRLLMLELPPFAPRARTLQDCIRHFMNERTNMRTCGDCLNLYQPSNPKGRTDGVGREWNRIREAPECLIMKLNRSKFKGKKPYKSTENVSIPETVDLTEYLEADDKDAGVTTRYRLDVLVSHAGAGVRIGHYICHVRNHADPTRWHCLNDQVVTNERFAEVVGDQRSRSRLFTPYLLGFTKIHGSANDEQSGGGTTTSGSHGVPSENDGWQRSDSKTGGLRHNRSNGGDSMQNEFKDDESSRETSR